MIDPIPKRVSTLKDTMRQGVDAITAKLDYNLSVKHKIDRKARIKEIDLEMQRLSEESYRLKEEDAQIR